MASKPLPGWPASMRRQLAADYCGLSVTGFEREIAAERLPVPFILDGREHWSKAQLDTALEKIASGADNDWERKLGLYDAA